MKISQSNIYLGLSVAAFLIMAISTALAETYAVKIPLTDPNASTITMDYAPSF